MWSQLKKVTKEGVTNTDMEVFNIKPRSSFGEHVENVHILTTVGENRVHC
jgi:hypothetical protein